MSERRIINMKLVSDFCGKTNKSKRHFSGAKANMRFGPYHAPLFNRTYVPAFGRCFDAGAPVNHGLDRIYSAAFGRLYNIVSVKEIPENKQNPGDPKYDEVLGNTSALDKYHK
jgi:hypothetical protein